MMSNPVTNRYEFVLYFDVANGNPNGDPDAGNMPRLDPETNQGLVSDVALKRKVRNFVSLFRDEPGHQIFVQERRPLNPLIAEGAKAIGLPDFRKGDSGWDKEKAKNRPWKDVATIQQWMCAQYYDIRTFGAVMSTGPNAGQVRGPVQMTFARSVEPILPLEQAITRVADVDKEEGEMGRKHIVPYGLYRAHGFVSAPLASHPAKGTGFSEDDVELLWQALTQMFDHDRSAARGEMATRKLILFRHESALGNAQAHALFDRVQTWRVHEGSRQPVGSATTDNWPPARQWADYAVTIDHEGLPSGIEIIERC